ncbi:uncharacterized protein BP5553_09889 [Venustampulla echinocandica]|uniref:NAD(P)-binding domain-containing protein n=1 Tax=Venustampulla echinocandica TaxID=2656787 RepID=A0A370TAY1_9HELO|nr:uncharacterized protein BP5553_09889 [Venustampulla echinocandica]RDL31100.1 hypothetical protein BP5553_09889 [Venustampulla echinocandica]
MLPIIGFFGATGGCAAACLAYCLREGYTCTALVRNADKLTKLLSAHDISASTIAAQLTVIVGNVKNAEDVRKTLFSNSGSCVDIVISGLGAAPTWKAGALVPSIDDPTVCTEATTLILSTLRAGLGDTPKQKPFIAVISTTGMSEHGRDIPLLYVPLYHWLLKVPHKDKKAMEELIIGAKDEGLIRDYCSVRATLLTDGEELGMGKIRAAVEGEDNLGEGAIGYTISRRDVGLWIFEEIVKKYQVGETTEEGRPVRGIARITY